MALFRRRDPVPQVVLPDHALEAVGAMHGDQSLGRARLKQLIPELLSNERVLACAANYAPWTSRPSLWVVTNRRLHEIREEQVRTILLAEIDGFAQGRHDIDYVLVVGVPSPVGETWPSHANEQLVFGSHETADAKRLHAAFTSMLGV